VKESWTETTALFGWLVVDDELLWLMVSQKDGYEADKATCFCSPNEYKSDFI
jgi:hypothetical protein